MSTNQKKHPEELPETSRSMRLLLLFCGLVGMVLLLAVMYRGYFIVKNSKFDGESGFIVSVMQRDEKKAILFVFDSQSKRVGKIMLESEDSLPNLRTTYAIPYDSELRLRTIDSIDSFPFHFVSFSQYNPDSAMDISILDTFRLWWFYRSLPDRNITTVKKKLEGKQSKVLIPQDFFIDSRMLDEKQSIAIINGTTIAGLGGRLERVITNIGGSVISVSTSHDAIKQSKIIYFGEETYTVKRLSRLFMLPAERREQGSLSDIIIELGDDSQRTTLF